MRGGPELHLLHLAIDVLLNSVMIRALVCFLQLLLPGVLWAHGSEFLGAKLRVLPSRELVLEVTADYGENPMIASREEAREALLHLLSLEVAGGKRLLRELAPLAFEERKQPDADSPLPTDATGKAHQLLTAIWRWRPPEELEAVRFQVPEAVNHATVFWLEEPGVQKEKKKWSMLLGGDSTPPVVLPKVTDSRLWAVFAAIICAIVAFLVLHRRHRSHSS